MYRDGRGVDRDLSAALDWFTLAGEQGNIACIFNIMALTWSGEGKDTERYDHARSMLERYAEGGSGDAITKLGNIYHDGTIAPKDYAKALYWYGRGADIGNVWCRQRLGEMYRDGRGVDSE